MAEFKLDRFKYRWRGEWEEATSYRRDDIVRVNGKSYVCLVTHTSDSDFEVDLNYIVPGSSPPLPDPKWIVMTNGRSFVGGWTTSTTYYLGDIVLFGGTLYICVDGHTSSAFENETSNWEIFSDHIAFEGDWAASTRYAKGSIVRYNGIVYRCTGEHVSGSTLEDNSNRWDVFFDGIQYRNSWTTSTLYRVNDLVRFGGSVHKCIETHTSTSSFDTTKFEINLPGYQFDGEWDATTLYQPGDIVSYGGNLFYALNQNIDSDPYETPADSTDNWITLLYSYNFRGHWTISENYRPGDIVQRGGNLYLALIEIGGGEPDGSTRDFIDEEWWELLSVSKKWVGTWTNGLIYNINDVVIYFGTTYVCKESHLSEINNFPGDNGSGYDYWDVLIQAGSEVGTSTLGDLLTYNLSRGVVGDGSTFGLTNVPIGTTDQVLTAGADELFWKTYINSAKVIYVGQHGVDEIGHGTIHKPFATVRYACEYVEDNFDPLTPIKISVATGTYEEILPIIVPAGSVVMGDELRSTTIKANNPITSYQNDYDDTVVGLTHFESLIDDLLNGREITPTVGNTEEQNFENTGISNDVVLTVAALIQDWKDFVSFNIGDGETNPTLTSTNTITTNQDFITAGSVLTANKNFIASEIHAYLTQENLSSGKTFDLEKIKNDTHSLFRGLSYDLRYNGNYKTLQSARRYKNAVLGSQTDDMFYLRDVTGLRNCTVTNLQGTLNPPGAFELFRRPTGGSFCSLDPGWGADDDRTWIVNRSPYIQGVTTIGTACIGQKIDGALHNGGNRSMVSNDFTQVLSDGIGAWITNNARAELVSVFTYYCAIGYFAENGGIIRATNGNNSYGRFGAIADGNDDREIPQTASVFNRNNEALVDGVFAGEFTDRIFAFEYNHCGEDYTTASAQITGSGADAEVEYDEVRDGAVYQLRLVNPEGSGPVGGSGYTLIRGNAQTGNSTSITLSGTSDLEEAELLGQRLIIVSGDGTGQYGYIDSYNPVSKIAQIKKESDNEPGWDHVLPGTPIEPALTSNAQYSIEPRLITSDPQFLPSTHNLDANTDLLDVTFGDTSETFLGVTGEAGSGETDESVTAVTATFDVTRNGSNYTVTIDETGAGYAVGDTITLSGTNFGGTSPTNDITIEVTATTDDSTNAITGFTYEGIGLGGKFVAISTPNFVQYSDDGVNWTQGNLPAVRDWKKVVSGNGKFVVLASDTNAIAYSTNGEDWVNRSIGSTENWSDIAFGGGKFVIIGENTNTVKYSTDGLTWSTANIPNDTLNDSTSNQWQKIAYGQGKFVVISGSGLATAQSTDGINWTLYDDSTQLPEGYEGSDWKGFVYGNNRFIAITETGECIYSLDGNMWYPGTSLPTQDGSTTMVWNDIKYGQGVFFAVCDTGSKNIGNDPTSGPTRYAVTTEDGLMWTERTLNNAALWQTVCFGSINQIGTWIVLARNQAANAVNRVYTGAKVKLRANITSGAFRSIKIWDPGSGYAVLNPPTISIVDNSFGTEVGYQLRLGNGVLPQPSFVNRGVGYRSATTIVTVTGDGYADIIPEGTTLVVSGIETVPGPGTQIRIEGILDPDTVDPDDLLRFTAVTVTDLGDDGTGAGTRLVQFRISPSLEVEYDLAHETSVNLRQRFSQCRITGHDFLDIGTGNFEETNYPELYAGGAFFVAAPENEVVELNGGRIYYTSTDQDGNFRTGELFSVEQATGIVTISADFFQLDGLSELALGGVRLGGSGTVVREFSTDPNFTEDSNSVIPTQRAIATFLANRLSEGGSELETNSLVAGVVQIGTFENKIDTTTGATLNITAPVSIQGDQASLNGFIIAQTMFNRNIDEIS